MSPEILVPFIGVALIYVELRNTDFVRSLKEAFEKFLGMRSVEDDSSDLE